MFLQPRHEAKDASTFELNRFGALAHLNESSN